LVFSGVIVSACVSAEDYYRPFCEEEGIEARTPAMAECVERKELERRRYRQFINTGRGNN